MSKINASFITFTVISVHGDNPGTFGTQELANIFRRQKRFFDSKTRWQTRAVKVINYLSASKNILTPKCSGIDE